MFRTKIHNDHFYIELLIQADSADDAWDKARAFTLDPSGKAVQQGQWEASQGLMVGKDDPDAFRYRISAAEVPDQSDLVAEGEPLAPGIYFLSSGGNG